MGRKRSGGVRQSERESISCMWMLGAAAVAYLPRQSPPANRELTCHMTQVLTAKQDVLVPLKEDEAALSIAADELLTPPSAANTVNHQDNSEGCCTCVWL